MLLLVVVFVLVVACGALAAHATATPEHASPPRKAFRCLRSFDAITTLAPKAMPKASNCDFGFMHLVNASATVHCKRGGHGCRFTVNFNASLAKRVRGDEARYSLELKRAGVGSIHYKGYGGELAGYSVCCEMLHQDGAICDWVERDAVANATTDGARKDLLIRRCALQEVHEKPGSVFITGGVSRPMYKHIAGTWEARLTFFRRSMDHVLGRLLVPFELTEEDARSVDGQHDVVADDAHSLHVPVHEEDADDAATVAHSAVAVVKAKNITAASETPTAEDM